MKRSIIVVLSLVLMISLLAACGNKQTQTTKATKPMPTGGLEDSIFPENIINGEQEQTATQPGNQGTSLPGQKPTQPGNDQASTPTTPTTPSTPATPTTPSNPATPTTPTNPTTPPTPSTPSGAVSIDYETFKAMTGAEKKAYQESFETIDAFFEWYNAALDAYKKANPPTEIDGSGNITLP